MAIDVAEVYRRYGPMVHRRCRRLLGDKEEAADAMHDVFVQLVRRQDRLVPLALPSLLYKMATDVCLNRLRSRRRRPQTRNDTILQFIAGVEGPGGTTEHRSMLAKIFAREKTSTRVIAVMHYVDRMTLQEVATEAGLSVSGVRKRLRGLQQRCEELREAAL